MQTYIAVCFIIFIAGFTQGLSGFGSILLSMPLLALFLDIKVVIPLVALAAFSMSVILFIQLRHYLEWSKIFPLLIGALPGIPIGVLFLKSMDKSIVQWVLGIILVAYALYSLISGYTGKRLHNAWGYGVGLLAGCLGGMLSAAGPPVIVYSSLQDWNKDQIKGTLQGFFVTSGIVVIIFQAVNGLTTAKVLGFYALSLPMLFLGTYLGSLLYGTINEKLYRKVMSVFLGCLGLFMIYRA